MKFRSSTFHLALLLLLLATLLASCSLAAPAAGDGLPSPTLQRIQPSATQLPLSPSTGAPTLETSPQPSLTPTPSSTAAAAATATATATETPTATFTATTTATPSPTSTPSPEPVRFAVIGDYGLAGEPERQVAALVDSWNVDFIITTGDNNYPDGAAETIDQNIGKYYHPYIYPYYGTYGEGAATNRFFPTLGNHDYVTSNAGPYFDYFTLPGNERYYDFTWGPVHFFALNSNGNEPDGVGRSSIQGMWLQQQMEASSAPWKIVYMHHSPYSSGYHGSIEWMRWPFAEWGASAVLSGHDHTYERLEVGGIPYFVNGVGGGPRYSFEEILPQSLFRFRNDYGAMLVTAAHTSLTFEFITQAGVVLDTYSLESGQ